jgi:alkaline phosphatase D
MAVSITRRHLLVSSATATLGAAVGLAMPALSRAGARPAITHGLQSGDVDTSSGMIWARADRPSRMSVEIATSDSFGNAVRLPPLDVLPETDFAAKRLVEDLPADQIPQQNAA